MILGKGKEGEFPLLLFHPTPSASTFPYIYISVSSLEEQEASKGKQSTRIKEDKVSKFKIPHSEAGKEIQ